MLTGIHPSSSSSSVATPPRYPLAHIYRVLMMAPRFIDMRAKNIFVQTATSASAALNKILLNEKHWESENPEPSIRAAIEKHVHEIPENQLQKEQLIATLNNLPSKSSSSTTQEVKKRFEDEINAVDPFTYPIGDYEWAVVCKLVMQSGNLLPMTPETHAALELFIAQLREMCEALDTKKYSKTQRFIRVEFDGLFFKEFLGQLNVLCQVETVATIHQYLYLRHLVLEQKEHNGLSEEQLPMTFAPGLFQGLGVFGRLIPRTGDKHHDTDADRREYNLFKTFMKSILELPLFAQPFDERLYAGIRQPDFAMESTAVFAPPSPRTREEQGKASRSFMSMFARFGISSSPAPSVLSSSSSSSISAATQEKPPSRRNSAATITPPPSVPPIVIPSVRFEDPEAPGYSVLRQISRSSQPSGVTLHSPASPSSSSSSLGSSPTNNESDEIDRGHNKSKKSGMNHRS